MSNYRLKGAAQEGTFLHRHSLSLTLGVILTVQTVVSLLAGRHVFVGEAHVNGTSDDWREFSIWFLWEYNLSLLADTFGVILIVLLSKRLIEAGSAESKEEPEDEQ